MKGMTALANSLNVLGVAQDVLDYGWGEQIYRAYNSQREATQNGSAGVQAPLLNTGRTTNGFNISNIFFTSIQTRIDTAKSFNTAAGGSGSGTQPPSNNSFLGNTKRGGRNIWRTIICSATY